MFAALGLAAQIAIVAHAPDTVATCDAVDVTVAVSARGASAPRLLAPSFAPFDVLRGGMPRIEYGARTRGLVTAEYRYTLATDRTGRFVIPPFEARLGSERASTRPLVIVVRPPLGRGTPAVFTRAGIDTSSSFDLRLPKIAAAETVYVGEQATYEVAVFLNQPARERLRRNPTFYPPEMQAMLAYDLPAPPPAARRRAGSQCFDALVYRRALFPLVPGRIVIPPAQLIYNTGLSSTSLFSREESHELQTDSVTIVALDPPAEGRPQDFTGAVGALRVDARIDSARSRVGDGLLLTVRVEGTGNVKLFPRPTVRVPWAGLVPADERVRVDSGSTRIGGVKEFDWVLTPRIAGEFDLPPTRYSYFDPARQRYDVALAPATRVRIEPGALASADTGQVVGAGALSIRTRFSGRAWPPVHTRPEFWALIALAPLPAGIARYRRRMQHRGPAGIAGAAATRADPARALDHARSDDPVTLRRLFVRALSQRLGCSAEAFTHPGALQHALRRSGVSEGVATRAELLLRDLDAAAYAPRRQLAPDAAERAAATVRSVSAEALARRELPFWVPLMVAAAALATAGAGAALAVDAATAHFARGVSSYLRQEYDAARDAFAAAVEAAPAAPDAWVNYGTASWAVHDTAAAVLGWRQTLAIEPSADDARARLELVRWQGMDSPGWVPRIPRNAASGAFLALWLAAWTFAWRAARARTRGVADRFALPLAACALLVAIAAVEVDTRVTGERLAVVRRAAPLVSHPALGMDRGPTVGLGEIVRVVGRRGVWTRVEAAGDRQGWLASGLLAHLEDRRPLRD